MKCASPSRFAHDISFKGDVRHGYKQNKHTAETGNESVVTVAVIGFVTEALGFVAHAFGIREITFTFDGAEVERNFGTRTKERLGAFAEKHILSQKRRIESRTHAQQRQSSRGIAYGIQVSQDVF